MLSAKDYKRILESIDHIYSAQDRDAMFKVLWEQLDGLIGMSSAIWLPMDSQTRQFIFKNHVRYHAPIKPAFLFTIYYAPINPLTESGYFDQDMAVFKMTDAISASRLPDTEYGCDFMPLTPHFYELVATPYSQGELLGGLGLHRQRHDRDFTERHREILKLILPHLSRAIHNFDLMEALTASYTAGVIVVSADGHPILMNEEARRALNGRPAETIPDPGIGAGPVFFRTQTGVYRVRTAPVRPGRKEKIIFLETQPSDREIQAKLSAFGVSQREMEVTLWAIRGLSNREIAERLFICEQTVKDHLHNVFEKMKIRRRSELAAKFLGIRPDESDETREA